MVSFSIEFEPSRTEVTRVSCVLSIVLKADEESTFDLQCGIRFLCGASNERLEVAGWKENVTA